MANATPATSNNASKASFWDLSEENRVTALQAILPKKHFNKTEIAALAKSKDEFNVDHIELLAVAAISRKLDELDKTFSEGAKTHQEDLRKALEDARRNFEAEFEAKMERRKEEQEELSKAQKKLNEMNSSAIKRMARHNKAMIFGLGALSIVSSACIGILVAQATRSPGKGPIDAIRNF